MTASPMRRADANRLALSGCTRRHSSRRTAFVAVVSARALRVRSASRSRSLPLRPARAPLERVHTPCEPTELTTQPCELVAGAPLVLGRREWRGLVR